MTTRTIIQSRMTQLWDFVTDPDCRWNSRENRERPSVNPHGHDGSNPHRSEQRKAPSIPTKEDYVPIMPVLQP